MLPAKIMRASYEGFARAWGATAVAHARHELDAVVTPAFSYHDANATIGDREEMVAYLIAFQKRRPGSTFVITSLLGHGHVGLGSWRLLDSFGLPIVTGEDYIEYDDDGRITRIVGFFDVAAQHR